MHCRVGGCVKRFAEWSWFGGIHTKHLFRGLTIVSKDCEEDGARLETSLAARRGEGARTGAAGAVGEEWRLLDSGSTLRSRSDRRLGRSQLEPCSRSHVSSSGVRGHRLGGREAGAANLVAEALAHEDGTVASHVGGGGIEVR